MEENKTKHLKFYSKKAIGFATFFGGPLAAGYLIGENYKSLNEFDKRKKSIIIGVISTLFIFIGLFLIPEPIIDKIPNQLIPLFYTWIIYIIVENNQGEILKYHKENNNEFYSGWETAKISFISLIILTLGIVLFVYFSTDNEIYQEYDKGIAKFSQNETETMKFYDHFENNSRLDLLSELNNRVLPKWEENLKIINKIYEIDNLPSDLIEQNNLLKDYSELRIKEFKLFKKAIQEDTDKYYSEFEKIQAQIDKVLLELN